MIAEQGPLQKTPSRSNLRFGAPGGFDVTGTMGNCRTIENLENLEARKPCSPSTAVTAESI